MALSSLMNWTVILKAFISFCRLKLYFWHSELSLIEKMCNFWRNKGQVTTGYCTEINQLEISAFLDTSGYVLR